MALHIFDFINNLSLLRKWVSRYGDQFRNVLVHFASVEYIFYVSLNTEFHNMRTEYKEQIPLIHFLLYFLLIINLRWSLDLSLPLHTQSLPSLLKLCCLTSSLTHSLKTLSLFQRYPFMITLPLQLMNLITEDISGWYCNPNLPNVLPTIRIP